MRKRPTLIDALVSWGAVVLAAGLMLPAFGTVLRQRNSFWAAGVGQWLAFGIVGLAVVFAGTVTVHALGRSPDPEA